LSSDKNNYSKNSTSDFYENTSFNSGNKKYERLNNPQNSENMVDFMGKKWKISNLLTKKNRNHSNLEY